MQSEVKNQKEESVTIEEDYVQIPDIGKVEVKIINRHGKGGTAFGVHGASKFVRREWVPVGNHLAQELDLAVYVPNLHSNQYTNPDNEEHSILALNFIVRYYKLENILLCGKSWGTYAIAEMALSGEFVHSMIFANPLNDKSLDSIRKKNCPVMCLTNEDDFAKETMKLYEEEWKDDENFVSSIGPSSSPSLIKPAVRGGHLMTKAFLKPMVDFVKKFYVDKLQKSARTPENVITEDDYVWIPDFGKVEVKIINRHGKGGTAFGVHGKSKFVRREWVPVGNHLAQELDLAVYVPNLHSNQYTNPENEKHSILALNFIVRHYKLKNILLCGKSWGTYAIAEMALSGEFVHSMIFANPLNDKSLDSIRKKNYPVMYLTNEDDYAKETMKLYEKEWKNDENFVSSIGPSSSPSLIKPTVQGGHLMTKAFLKPMVEFVKKFYVDKLEKSAKTSLYCE